MRVLLLILAFALTACAPSQSSAPETKPGTQNQPHLPPPGFPVSEIPPSAQVCGGMVAGPQQDCGDGQYCHREIKDMCGAADAPGYCRPLPEACTMEYDPVCGCDGKTYSNECVANSKGVSAASKGECS